MYDDYIKTADGGYLFHEGNIEHIGIVGRDATRDAVVATGVSGAKYELFVGTLTECNAHIVELLGIDPNDDE